MLRGNSSMKKAGTIQAAMIAVLGMTAGTYAHADSTPSVDPPELKFFDQYCSKCHNSTDWAGGVAFDTMPLEGMYDDAKVWEEAVKKLRGRLMPPPDKPQPSQ